MKIFFYLSSVLTTILILLVNPSKNNNPSYQSKILSFRSNHLFAYRFIGLMVLMFFISVLILSL